MQMKIKIKGLMLLCINPLFKQPIDAKGKSLEG